MKKTLALFTTAALLTSIFTGCGNVSSGSSSGSKSGSDKNVKLTLMVTTRPSTNKKDFYLDYLPQLVKEKFPNVTLNVEQLPTDQYTSTMKVKLSSGQGPDLFTWWPDSQAKPLVAAGYVKDLSSLPVIGNFNKDMIKSYSFDGKTYALPTGMSFLTTWYNKSLFQKANITAVPQNWDEFLGDCDKLKKAGIIPIVMGDKQAFEIQFGMYQAGASLIYADNPNFDKDLLAGKTKFTDPQWVETVKRYKELYDKGYVATGTLGLSEDQARQMFTDGKVAMKFDGNFGYDQMMKNGAVSFERGMFPLPSNDAGKKLVVNLSPGNGVFVNAKSENAEVAMEILKYWFTKDTPLFNKWVETNTMVSPYVGTSSSLPLVSGYIDKYKDFQTVYNLNNAWPAGVSDEMCNKFQELIAKSGSAEDVCKAMQAKLDELIKK